MLINVADAKAKFSHLLALVDIGKEEVIIAKRDKPTAVLVSYETFLRLKKRQRSTLNDESPEALPTSLDRFIGAVSEEEVDIDYKESREAYLKRNIHCICS